MDRIDLRAPYEEIRDLSYDAVPTLRDLEDREALDSSSEELRWARVVFRSIVDSHREAAERWGREWVPDARVSRPRWDLETTVNLTEAQQLHLTLLRLLIEEAAAVHRYVDRGLPEDLAHDPELFVARAMWSLEVIAPGWIRQWRQEFMPSIETPPAPTSPPRLP